MVVDGFGNVIVAGQVPQDFIAGHFRKYDSAGALLCETTLSLADDGNTIFMDAVIADDGLPRITGQAGLALYVAAPHPA